MLFLGGLEGAGIDFWGGQRGEGELIGSIDSLGE